MYFTYTIESKIRNYTYVGLTNNIERRLAEHNNGENRSTKAYRLFCLVFEEAFETRVEARAKEKYLKTGIGKEFLKKIKT